MPALERAVLWASLVSAAAAAGQSLPLLQKVISHCVDGDQTDCCLSDSFNTTTNPSLGVYPFLDSCPKVLDAASVCAAIGGNSSFVNTTTASLLPRATYTVPTTRGFGVQHQSYVAEPSVGYRYQSTRIYEKPGEASGGANPPIMGHTWTADTSAAVMAIGTPTGCYNIYGDVELYAKLDAECSNDILGDPTMAVINLLQEASIVTAGNFYLTTNPTNPSDFGEAIVVGGDLQVLQVASVPAFALDVAVNAAPLGGAFAGFGFMVLGDLQTAVFEATQLFTVTNGNAGLSSSEFLDAVQVSSGSEIVLSEDEIASFRTSLQVLSCSSASQMAVAQETGSTAGTTGLIFQCDNDGGDSETCFIDISADQLMEATSASVILNEYSALVVRVSGENIVATALGELGGDQILFAFLEAHSITVNVPNASTSMPLFAPYAHSLDVLHVFSGADFTGPFLMGNRKSTISISNVGVFNSLTSDSWPVLPGKGVDDVQVWICDCACNPQLLRTEKSERLCLPESQYTDSLYADPYGHHLPSSYGP